MSFATNAFVDWALSTLTVSAVVTSCFGLLLIEAAYVDSEFTHTAGYVVALHELLMKFAAGLAAAAEALGVETYRRERITSENVRMVGVVMFDIFVLWEEFRMSRLRPL